MSLVLRGCKTGVILDSTNLNNVFSGGIVAKRRATKAQTIRAIVKARGYVTKAADILGVNPQTIYNYANQYPDVAEAIHNERERRHDFVESQLMGQIKNRDTTAIIFYLKTQAKHRGWVERQEVTGRDGAPLESTRAEVKIYIPDNGRGD